MNWVLDIILKKNCQKTSEDEGVAFWVSEHSLKTERISYSYNSHAPYFGLNKQYKGLVIIVIHGSLQIGYFDGEITRD